VKNRNTPAKVGVAQAFFGASSKVKQNKTLKKLPARDFMPIGHLSSLSDIFFYKFHEIPSAFVSQFSA
jgi:hypothetical protein